MSVLARRFIAYVILTCLATTLISFGYGLYYEYSKISKEVARQFDSIGETALPSLIANALTANADMLRIQLEGLVRHQYVSSAVLKLEKGEVLRAGNPAGSDEESRTYRLDYPFMGKIVPLGTLTVTADAAAAWKELKSFALLALAAQAFESFCLALIVVLFFHLQVGRRILAVVSHAAALGPDRLETPLRLPRAPGWGGPDELDRLAATLGGMREKLARAFGDERQANERLTREIAERREAEACLAASEERYRALFGAVRDPVVVLEMETGVIVECNQAAEGFLGRPRDQLIGLPQRSVHAPEQSPAGGRTEHFKQLAARPGLVENIPFLTPDGATRLASIQSGHFEVRGKKYMVGVFRDVTDRKRHEEALERSLEEARRRQAEIEALQEASRAILSTQEFSRAARDIFHACRRLIGARAGYVCLLSPDGLMNEVMYLFPGGTPCNADPSLPMPIRGLRREAYDRARPVYDNAFSESFHAQLTPPGHMRLENVLFAPLLIGGKVQGVIGLANKTGGFTDRDVRLAASFGELAAIALQNSRTLERLENSEARFRSVAQSAADAIVTIDEQGRVTFANEAAAEMFGFPSERIAGRLAEELMPERFRQAHRRGMGRFWETGELRVAGTAERIGLKQDGTEFPMELSLAAWQTAEGRHVTGIIRDVSDRRRDEAALIEATRAADSANKAKSEFLANMSHEIRTPLNGVLGMLQLLETTPLNEEQKDYVTTAAASSKRLTRLLSDILDLSRVEAGKLRIQEAVFEVKELGRSVLDIFGMAATAKGLALTFFLDPAAPKRLIGDETRLRQILFNLAGNAIKFTDAGEVRVDIVRLSSREPNRVRLLILVEDTGIGIPEERLRDVFDPFVQAEQSYVRSRQGAGLGLAIVRRLVGLMGGELSIDSAPGEGTTVALSLPFSLPEPVAAPEAGAGASDAAKPLSSRRALVVEDDEVSLLAALTMLTKCGCQGVAARNGREALDAWAKEDFDLILMDVQMPVMDGLEAARIIRRMERDHGRRRTPILAMTAYAMVGDREKFLAAGMDAYLAKPVDMATLRGQIVDLTAGAAGEG